MAYPDFYFFSYLLKKLYVVSTHEMLPVSFQLITRKISTFLCGKMVLQSAVYNKHTSKPAVVSSSWSTETSNGISAVSETSNWISAVSSTSNGI